MTRKELLLSDEYLEAYCEHHIDRTIQRKNTSEFIKSYRNELLEIFEKEKHQFALEAIKADRQMIAEKAKVKIEPWHFGNNGSKQLVHVVDKQSILNLPLPNFK